MSPSGMGAPRFGMLPCYWTFGSAAPAGADPQTHKSWLRGADRVCLRLVRVRCDPPPVSGGVPRNQATFPGIGRWHLAAREMISSGALQQQISLSYQKTLNDASTRTPERQRAAEVGNKYAGGKPKASADQIGVQPDDARLQREEQPRKQSGDR
jgi:hypothetical protein